MFKSMTLKSAFDCWKNEAITYYNMTSLVETKLKNQKTNPNSQQREKILRAWKGLLIMQNKRCETKYSIMA